MRRLIRALILVAAAAVVVSVLSVGCSYVNPPALTISADATSDPYFTLTREDLLKESEAAQAKAPAAAKGKPSYSTATIAASLTKTVNEQIAKQQAPAKEEAKRKLLAAHNAKVTDEDRNFATQIASQGSQGGAPPAADVIEAQAELVALARVMGEDEFSSGRQDKAKLSQALYEANKDKLAQPAQSCWHVIVIAPAADPKATTLTAPTDVELAQAQAAKARLAAESFETVANELSAIKDQAPGGDLSCQDDSKLPKDALAAVAGLAIGTVSDPIKLADSYALIRVDKRTPAATPTFEELKSQVEQAVVQQVGQKVATPEIKKIAEELAQKTVVTVDPRFGVWDPLTKKVNPPEGASDPTVPTTSTTVFNPNDFGKLIPGPGATPGPDGSGSGSTTTSTTASNGSTTASNGSTTTRVGSAGPPTTTTAPTGSTTTTAVSSTTTSTVGGRPNP